MAKQKEYKRVSSVAEFNKVSKKFNESKAILESNQKWFEKRFGNEGGSVDFEDGFLTLTPKEENGKESASYKSMLEELEKKILDGELYQMSKETAIGFMADIRAKHTKPQMSSQKIQATESNEKTVQTRSNMVKTL